jgi:hypothetical protein
VKGRIYDGSEIKCVFIDETLYKDHICVLKWFTYNNFNSFFT